MGIVHEGVDIEMGRTVAVKRLKDEHAADRRNIKQFEHEARVTGLLEHPGIVPVYGRGKDPGGRPFYAMRMVEGERLTTAIDRLHEAPCDDPRSPELRRLLARFVTVCNTVAYAHTRGFAHLDLKPSNILLGPFGETFTMDWGLAMKVDRPVRRSSGTAHYMSPEQVERRFDEVGPASDVYALGAVLYTIVTGRKPSPSGDSPRPETLPEFPGRSMPSAGRRWNDSPSIDTPRHSRWPTTWSDGWPTSRFPYSRVIGRAASRGGCADTDPRRWPPCWSWPRSPLPRVVTAVVVSLARAGEHQALMRGRISRRPGGRMPSGSFAKRSTTTSTSETAPTSPASAKSSSASR